VSFYGFARATLRAFLPLAARLRVEGVGHVPPTGPFILIANHRSLLDAVLAQVACPRVVHTMTKSTQFGSLGGSWLLPRLRTFPVRRYTVDPQAVRTVLHLLGQGEAVGVYPEAERSWDGRPQPFRRGTVRLILKAGVPVVPCGISGAFAVWPRWSGRPRRGPVTVRFGAPLTLGRHETRAEREAAFENARTALRAALEEVVDEPVESPA
jgi:1-acyl-sn-glycerol-3-phosphate acyltransferase